jgi:hypothetical protein
MPLSLSCLVECHSIGASAVGAQGFELGRCRRCGLDLLRSSGRWKRVPKGFRVAWGNAPADSGASPRPAPRAGRAGRLRAAVDLVAVALRFAGWQYAASLRGSAKAIAGARRQRRRPRLPAPVRAG